MDSWMLLKKEGDKFFKLKDYQKACDHYKDALTEIESQFDESKHELKVEASKITSNISLMYWKLSKEQNDESLLLRSKIYAKKMINHNPKWIIGYLRLAHVCKLSKNVDDILNATTVYLQDNKNDVLNDDFKSLLKEVKYYTHKTIMELSPSWHLVKYKDNVFVVDPLGAGHFKDFEEFLNYHGTSVQRISVLVRPGIYIGTYVLINANIDIVGDFSIEINPTTKAIDKDPTVIFTNTLIPAGIAMSNNASSTFFFKDSEVSLKRISVYGEMNDLKCNAIICEHTVINLLECSFVSKCIYSLYCYESSNLYCKSCRSVGGFVGIVIESKSRAKLTDCFISEMDGAGIQARNEAEMISLKHCTVTNFKRQGLIVFDGTKMAKVIESHFEGNCSTTSGNAIRSISLHGCRALVKNTFIQNQNSVGIFVVGGIGNFVNVTIKNCYSGIVVQGNVIEITNCFIDSCSRLGILIDNFLKGTIVLENNSITNCPTEIARSDNTPMPTFKGEKKHAMETYPSIDGENESRFKEIRKSRREESMGTNIGSEVDNIDLKSLCSNCLKNEFQLQGSSKTLKVCEECKMVLYCSPECQQKNWKIHKPHCDVYVKTKLAAREGIKVNQTNKKRDSNETEENDASGDVIVKKETTE